MTLDHVVATVDGFVTRTRGRQQSAIGPDTRLFQEGLLDSFGMAELAEDLSKVAGKPIPEGELLPDDFDSPRVLFARLSELLK